jgi:hypothetical protein
MKMTTKYTIVTYKNGGYQVTDLLYDSMSLATVEAIGIGLANDEYLIEPVEYDEEVAP